MIDTVVLPQPRPAAEPVQPWADFSAKRRAELVRFASYRLGRSRLAGQDAEDLVQDVLVRVLAKGAAADRPDAYLRRAVANECISHWRRHHRELPTDEIPDRVAGDHAQVCADRLTVHKLLDRLTRRQREILIRGFVLDDSDADIAAELGISPVTVRTLRRRGLAHLRAALTG